MNKTKLLHKKENTIFMAILIIILECFAMFSAPYSKSVLPLQDLSSFVWSLLIFALFFIAFNGYIIINFTKLSFAKCKQKTAISFGILLLVRLVLDLNYYIFAFSGMTELVIFIADFVYNLAMFQILLYIYTKNNLIVGIKSAFIQKDKAVIILTAVCLLIFVAFSSFLLVRLLELSAYTEKYTVKSQFYVFQQMNTMFDSQKLRMVFAVISEIAMVLLINALFGKMITKPNNTFSRVLARSRISIVLVTVLLFAKIFVFPTGSIKNINSENSNAYVGIKNLTSNSFTQKQIYRANGTKQDILCYENTEIETKYYNDLLIKFKLCNFFDYEYVNAEKNNIERANGGAEVNINGQKIVFFANQYVVFVKNNTPYVIALDDIKNQSENEVLTSFIKYMISCGYWDYFEYGCDYLKKYDSDFIKPYIERYANGNFTEDEINENREINTEYMINFAKEKLS